MSIPTITARELDEQRRAGQPAELIDVRTPAEYREVHAEGARLVPLDRLDPKTIRSEQGNTAAPVYLLCRTGGRAKKACEQFLAAGYQDVYVVEGGTQAWEQAGLPVVRGRKTISLERQVRIAAGLLVLLGTALGAFVHIGFLGIAGFVGAGLVFAGLTDWCGMGMLLARAPWNQVNITPDAAAKPSNQPSADGSGCCSR
jgi:rhodanese-related sulfurtransferase